MSEEFSNPAERDYWVNSTLRRHVRDIESLKDSVTQIKEDVGKMKSDVKDCMAAVENCEESGNANHLQQMEVLMRIEKASKPEFAAHNEVIKDRIRADMAEQKAEMLEMRAQRADDRLNKAQEENETLRKNSAQTIVNVPASDNKGALWALMNNTKMVIGFFISLMVFIGMILGGLTWLITYVIKSQHP